MPRFFAVSSYKGDKVWYDDIVTRISLSLSGK
jgi:hypothetical protein